MPALDTFFETVQSACLPAVWSRGMALVRTFSVTPDPSRDPSEKIFRVRMPDRPVSAKVSLWWEDEDWFCDCGDRNDPCAHVAAAVIHWKAPPKAPTASLDGAEPLPSPKTSNSPRVQYEFTRSPEGFLNFQRVLTQEGRLIPLRESLVAYIGGIQSGRIPGALPNCTQADFALDALISQGAQGRVPTSMMALLLEKLREASPSTLDSQPIQVSSRKLETRALLKDERGGFRLTLARDTEITENFKNGAALCGDLLRPTGEAALATRELEAFSGEGTFFPVGRGHWLASEYLPGLEARLPVLIESSNLPARVEARPRIVLELDEENPEKLSILPRLLYGDPPIAEVLGSELVALSPRYAALRDLAAEKEALRKLQGELHLQPRQRIELSGPQAVQFRLKLKDWETTGRGADRFTPQARLEPRMELVGRAFKLSFGSPGKEADPTRVFQAWRENQSFVPLIDGGWAELPGDWLARYGERILKLLQARDEKGELPSQALPALSEMFVESGAIEPVSLRKLRETLETFVGMPRAKLPSDLTASLRPYQVIGVDWLRFLGDQGLGALLADDMGLGKTLQALCAIESPALIVAPTSVLASWSEQARKFRPGLKVSLYHGAGRRFEEKADLVLTSYGVLRADEELLVSRAWKTVILDEAQTIRNTGSQIARAAHRLRAERRIALSGTPVENRLEDLWSQFRFLNPGVLGSLEEFREELAQPIARGNPEAGLRLRKLTRPFLLRRLKKQVAPELPPRTEIVLRCELDEEERRTYGALLASARREVVEKISEGGSILGALEALLRLRQACCHRSMIPGEAPGLRSSKTELLWETLEASIAGNHRALVFSQWTSYLDQVEPGLSARGIRFSRLDGSTSDRGRVVREFQDPAGPSVMLISLKAGGVGITLTAADHIFILDPWWNPAVEEQAADRAHRIGQENPVLVHRLVAEDTVEERILLLQQEKRKLAASVLDPEAEGSSAGTLTREDLLGLLGE